VLWAYKMSVSFHDAARPNSANVSGLSHP